MKTIKLKICNSNLQDPFSFGSFFLRILTKYYIVELTERPDYVIYNDTDFEYLNYNCVRIFFTGENVTPNFNLCDYAVGCDYLTFEDRFYRMPLYLIALYYSEQEQKLAATLLGEEWSGGDPDFTKQKIFSKADLLKKSGFCSFVYSNYLADSQREEIFNKLSEYKKVNAGGAYLNNTGGKVASKLEFELEHKFSIAFENSSRPGYTTEKLVNSLIARTVPVYWGNPEVAKEFNSNRFINCHAYKNFEEVVEKVKEIDQNDELYLKIINQPIAAEGYDYKAVREGFEKFIQNIFNQPIKEAGRRTINTARARVFEAGEKLTAKNLKQKYIIRKLLSAVYKPLKKVKFLERIKQRIISKQFKGFNKFHG